MDSKINWNNLYKIRIANSNSSFLKHEVTKLIIVMKLLEKHRHERRYIRIYTEFSIKENKFCDIYYENMKTKEGYIFEIQKKDTKDWEKGLVDFYRDFNVTYLNSTDLIIIKLNNLSDDIQELSKQLDDYII